MKPYAWIPTLYFAEAVPYMAVMTLSVIMYTRLGLSNTELALYTSWLYLPWVIKPLWSPLVDQWRTKRWWILSMQVLVGGALAGVALTLPMAMWLRASLAFFWLMAFSSATHDIAADGLVAGWLESRHSVPMAWSITMLLMGAIMIGLAGWHFLSLPKEETEPRQEGLGLIDYTLRPFAETLKVFFSKPHIWAALLFMLLFRLPEAQLAKMAQPFMLRPLAEGGLELGTATVGFAYGTLGVIGLLAGGIIGGWVVSKHGLRRWLWPMVCAITLPDVVYVYMSYAMPENMVLVSSCIFIEQFGYGLGFTALTLYMLYFSMGPFKTSFYAICTGLSYLGLQVPAMFSGFLKDAVGYQTFFLIVMALCGVTFLVAWFVKIDPEFGKKK